MLKVTAMLAALRGDVAGVADEVSRDIEREADRKRRDERLITLEERREAGRTKHIRLKRVGKEMVTWSLGLVDVL